jgi:outer membrane receptor protein involved in Fe transport
MQGHGRFRERRRAAAVWMAQWGVVCAIGLLAAPELSAAEPCPAGTHDVRGVVVDSHGAPVAAAALKAAGVAAAPTENSGQDGSFLLPCWPDGAALRVEASSFAARQVTPGAEPLRIVVEPATALTEVTVTAFRTPLSESESPASVRLVPGEELRTAAPVTLDDRLRQVPGFELFRRSSSLVANPTSQGVSLRGLGSTAASRTLVVEDEVPLNDAFGGWIYWDELPELSVADVTVVRGGASDLYGSSAIGGVVEVAPVSGRSNHAELLSSEGSFHTFDEAGLLSGTRGGWSGLATGGVLRTDGYRTVAPEQRGPVDIPANLHAENGRLLGERDFGGSGAGSGTARRSGHAFLLGNVLNEARSNGTPLTTNGTRLWRYEGGVNWQPEGAHGGVLLLRGYGSSEHFRQSFSSVNAARTLETLTRRVNTPSDQLGGAIRWTQPLGPRLVVLGGADTRDVRGADREVAVITGAITDITARQRQTGVYGEAVWTPRQWTLSASGRIDHFQNFDALQRRPAAITLPLVTETVADPRLGVVRRLGSTVALTATGFRAYRAPTLNELYRNGQVGQELTLHNPSLLSERATGGEAGIVITPRHANATLRASYFWTEVNRPITALTIRTTPTAITNQRANLGQIRSRGVALDGEWQPLGWLTAVGGYQYADATVTRFDQQPALVGRWIPQVPHQTGTLQLRAQQRRVGLLSLEGRSSGQQFDDDRNAFRLASFFTFNAYASHTFQQRYEVFAAGENLLNRRIEAGRTPVLTLAQPQTVRGGLRIRLGHE